MLPFDLAVLLEYALLLLVPGIVETSKKFGLQGNWCLGLSIVLAAFFGGLAQADAQGLLPEVALPWIRVALVSLGAGLGGSGYYDMFKKFTGNGG